MEWLWIASGAALALLALLLLFGYIVFVRVSRRRKERAEVFEAQFSEYRLAAATEKRLRNDYEWFDSHRTRELCVTSEDGLKLHATLIEAPKDTAPRGVILMLHGCRSNPRRDFCMHFPILHSAGYHILAAEQRSHARSEGKYICYGTLESGDVMLWREKAAELYGKDMPVAFFGLSMGGATVLMASGRVSREDTGVRCIIADCPFSSPKDIVSHVMKNHNHLPPEPALSFADFWCRTLAGFSLSTKSNAEILASSHLPALLLHGSADDYVPPSHSQSIAEAVPERTKLVLFEGAKHANSIYCDENRYVAEMLDFLEKNMKI